MAILNLPKEGLSITDISKIRSFLSERGVFFDIWPTIDAKTIEKDEEYIHLYAEELEPYMQKNGYKVADVLNINENTPNYDVLRAKFLKEHIHTEDEVRFFIDGEGYFWFHIENNEVFNVKCQKGDIIAVPAGYKHWFDAGEKPMVKVIRVFTNTEGWVPHYTDSNIEKNFQE